MLTSNLNVFFNLQDLMNKIAGLASENIGLIDWEPYIPILFTRILRSLDLPVCYKNMKSSRAQALWSSSIASMLPTCDFFHLYVFLIVLYYLNSMDCVNAGSAQFMPGTLERIFGCNRIVSTSCQHWKMGNRYCGNYSADSEIL